MKSKIIKSAAIAVAAAMVLAGCGGNREETKKMPSLTYYMFGTTANVQDGIGAVTKKLNEIANEKIGVNLDLQILELSVYEQQMTVKLASGEKLDLMFTSPWLNNYSNLAGRNALLELDELLPKYAPEYYNSIPKEWWDCARINGKIYGAINQQIFARQNTMVYLKEAVDKTGFDWKSVKKIEDLEPYFIAAKKAGYNTDEYIMWGVPDTTTAYQYWGFEAVGSSESPGVIRYYDKKAKVFNQFESEEFLDYLRLVREWNKKGLIAKDALSTTSSRTKIFKINGCYKPGYTETEEKATFSSGKDIYYQPIGNSYLTTGNVIATMTGISKTCKYPQEAVELINLINTDNEFFNTMCFGIDGVDYTKNSDGTIKKTDSPKYDMGSYAWAFGNQFNAYVQEGVPVDTWKQQDEFNRNSDMSDILGFSFDETNVQTEVANCNAVVSEYLKPFMLGFLDIDDKYPEFMDKLKAAGADKIVQEKQKQIDEYLANK